MQIQKNQDGHRIDREWNDPRMHYEEYIDDKWHCACGRIARH